VIAWRGRAPGRWLSGRGKAFWAGVSVVGIALVVGGAFAFRTWSYVAHDDEFCTSCHSREETFERLRQSEHVELSCRDCHKESTSASLRQVQWVFDPPEEVGPHAPVASSACADCHITDDPESPWQGISATVGHRIHLEADTSALKGVVCLTCHGEELHRFEPADATCGQSGCHDPSKTQVVLGEMAGQTGFHCVTCHQFTAPVSEQAPLDTVRAALTPALEQCSSCHEMDEVLVGLDSRRDPHDAVCGTCHNPHTQESPAEAANRCAECHAPAHELTPFHRGLRAEVAEDCKGCHKPHTFRVEGENCVACHADIVGEGPAAGAKAQGAYLDRDDRRDVMVAVVERSPLVRQVGLFARPDVATTIRPHASAANGELLRGALQQPRFNHREHRDVQCIDCHVSRRTHGELALESRAQCLECHHSSRVAATGSGCARCHSRAEISAPRMVQAAMTIRGQTTTRRIAFDHDNHAGASCVTCHTRGASRGVSRTCASCHQNHHTATADCTTCHRADARQAHTPEVHSRSCAGSSCHESGQYGSMTQGRNTCLACHTDRAAHRPGRACASCHRVSFASGGSPEE